MAATLQTWESSNAVQLVDPSRDALYRHDVDEQKRMLDVRPWKKDPRYFKDVRISAVALLKMVTHARSGGSLEVMGLMQGKVVGHTFVVTDAFRLPVEGTETRVNAQDDANEYMPAYLQSAREAGQMENAVGWYHSHPGYGCWLSGIDVDTQVTHQTHYDPYLAVVIDPERTISAGKVDIGAFRTYPADYKPKTEGRASGGGGGGGGGGDEYQSIPMAKIEDFGAHSSRYYPLQISTFKSTIDARLLERLWKKYWVATLSQSPLVSNRDYVTKQMTDLALKIRKAEQGIATGQPKVYGGGGGGGGMGGGGGGGDSTGVMGLFDTAVAKGDRSSSSSSSVPHGSGYSGKSASLKQIILESNKLVGEEMNGLMAGVIKEGLFNELGSTATKA